VGTLLDTVVPLTVTAQVVTAQVVTVPTVLRINRIIGFFFGGFRIFVLFSRRAYEVKKKTMSGMKFKKEKKGKEEDEAGGEGSVSKRIEKGKKRFEDLRKEMKKHESNMLEKLNLDKVKDIQKLVADMSKKTMHADELEAKLSQLEQMIEDIAKSIQTRGKGGGGGGNESDEEREGEGEGEVQNYQRQQRALFQELHSY
jgi:predicted phage tail protein